jgi:hypothetical protein
MKISVHIVNNTRTFILSTAREGSQTVMKTVLSEIKEEIHLYSTVEQCEHGKKIAAIGNDRKAIDQEMRRLVGLIK